MLALWSVDALLAGCGVDVKSHRGESDARIE